MEKLFFPLIAVGICAAVVFVQEGQRRIPVQYAKRMVGRKMTAGGSTYLPLRVNMAGVIPIIFAAAILAFPPTMAQYFPATRDFVNEYFQPGDWIYLLIEGFMIVIFTYFYTAVQFNPVDQADNLRKYGGYIPGIRPGPPTAQYLDRVLSRLTLPGLAVPRGRRGAPEPVHRVRRLLAGERGRARRHVGADRGRRRARHHAADGVADDDALLRGLPQVAPRGSDADPHPRPTGVRQGDAGEADRRGVRRPARRDRRHPARGGRRRLRARRAGAPDPRARRPRAGRPHGRSHPRAPRRRGRLRARRLPAHDARRPRRSTRCSRRSASRSTR